MHRTIARSLAGVIEALCTRLWWRSVCWGSKAPLHFWFNSAIHDDSILIPFFLGRIADYRVSHSAISNHADSWGEREEIHQHRHVGGVLQTTYRPGVQQPAFQNRQICPMGSSGNLPKTACTPLTFPNYRSCRQIAQRCCHQDPYSRKKWSVHDL